jgi:hypothetical protein
MVNAVKGYDNIIFLYFSLNISEEFTGGKKLGCNKDDNGSVREERGVITLLVIYLYREYIYCTLIYVQN